MFHSSGRVIGVDPGLSRCGIAVIDGHPTAPQLVDSAVVRTPADAPLGQRLGAVHDEMLRMIDTYQPARLAVERVFINAQVRTGTGATQVVGVVHLTGHVNGLETLEYTPSQVKAAVTGTGTADKEQVMYMVQRMLRLDAAPRPADRADAMAVALCDLAQPGWTKSKRNSVGGRTQPTVHPGMSPRLAAALAAAGPGLAPLPRKNGR